MLFDELEEKSPCNGCLNVGDCNENCEEFTEWCSLISGLEYYDPSCFYCENFINLFAAYFDEDMEFSYGARTNVGLCKDIGYLLVDSGQEPCVNYKCDMRLLTKEKAHQLLS